MGTKLTEEKLFLQRIGLVGIVNILIAINSIILLPILTKNFSISDYGIWVQITVTIGLIPNIVTLGLPLSMIRFLSHLNNKEKIMDGFYSILIIVIVTSAITSVIFWIFSGIISSALFEGNIFASHILSIILFISSLNLILINYFRSFQQIKVYSLFLFLQTYANTILVAYLTLSGYGLSGALIGTLLANIILFILMIMKIIISIGFNVPNFKNMREYLNFGLPTIPSNLSYWITDSSDRYLIAILLGATFVGYYSPGYVLGTFILMFMTPFTFLLPSVLTPYYEKREIDKIEFYLRNSLKFFLLISIPSVIGISLLSKSLLLILTTPEIALNSYYITPLIAIGALLIGYYGIISSIILLIKKTQFMGKIWLVAAFLNLFLNFIIIPYLGIIGAAIATLVSYIFIFAITMNYTRKFIKIDFNIHFVLKSIFSSCLMGIFIIIMHPKSIIEIFITIIISSLIYFIVLYILKGVTKKELIFIKKMFINRTLND